MIIGSPNVFLFSSFFETAMRSEVVCDAKDVGILSTHIVVTFFKKDRFFIPYRGLLFFCYLPLKAFALYKHANRKFQRKLYTKWAQKKGKRNGSLGRDH